MKYYFDTEFIEGMHKPIFGKRRHFIDLISIGIVDENGREYFAISNEFNPDHADAWVKENVIRPMLEKWTKTKSGDERNRHLDRIDGRPFSVQVRMMQREIGISNKQIATGIKRFVGMTLADDGYGDFWCFLKPTELEFYAYYADYDWVLFCSLFGRMIDLPKGFPMYCRDLKQIMDEKADRLNWYHGRDYWSNNNRSIHTIGKGEIQRGDRLATLEEKLKVFKELREYPKQKAEHDALSDAEWNKRLHLFLQCF